jgi:hypothetical protein
MNKNLWIAVIVGCGLGFFTLLKVLFLADSAPQQAAGAGIALAYSIIPYCLIRAVQELQKSDEKTKTEE